MPRPLLSEALRGHGALLRDARGERFVDELQPRDVVSRAEAEVMREQHVDHVWLDATDLEDFDQRFPTIARALASAGLDPSRDWLPVAPAAHYTCGGIVTDLEGASSLDGLWAAGEAADTGVHGANRLASNSLLEGMVFGPRAVEAIERGIVGAVTTGAMRAVLGSADPGSIGGILMARPEAPVAEEPTDDPAKARAVLQQAMTIGAGVERNATSLAAAGAAAVTAMAVAGGDTPQHAELRSLAEVARAVTTAATRREESRGAHARSDFPETSDALRRRIVLV
jgi:L-aspartate oxidase